VAKLVFALFMLKRFGKELAGAIGTLTTPAEIHLSPASAEAEAEAEESRALAAALEAEGFHSAGAFEIAEMEGVVVRLLVHEGERLMAAAYDHPMAGSWFDVVERRTNGGSTTWTTSAPTGLDRRPGHRQLHEPGATPAALVARARDERGPGAAEAITVAGVREAFERAYAEYMAYRQQNLPTRQEIERVEQRPIRRAA
jgi:hypothetical protein